jgi:NAD(P)-dependent dehydrogenase (short-subunit alcohol dehydrogenase family)
VGRSETRRRSWWRKPTADQVLEGCDLVGRTVLVTGADSGIGFCTARALAARGASVWLGCLRQEDGERAAEQIRARHPGAYVAVTAFDLGDLQAVREAARALPVPALHALVCNAGVYGGPYTLSRHGFERTFAVCYLGHAALVQALLPRLLSEAPARVVLVSSQNHWWPVSIDIDSLPIGPERYSELAAYGEAKRCVVLLARALTDVYGARGLTANALHPGDLVSTGIDRDSGFLRVVMRLARPLAPTPEQAAATSVYLATAPELQGVSGRYFVNGREARAAPGALDPALAARLWARTEGWLSEVWGSSR